MDSSLPSTDQRSAQDDRLAAGPVEATGFSRAVVRSLFPLLICSSLSFGWWVPAFYDWSGDNQSRSPAIVGYAFKGFAVACFLTIVALPLFPRLRRTDPVLNPLIWPCGRGATGVSLLAGIFVAVAAGLSAFRDATFALIGFGAFLYPLLCAVRIGLCSPSLRWRIASLYSCLYLPFIWLIANDVVQGIIKQGSWRFLPLLPGAPAMLASLLISQITGRHDFLMSITSVIFVGLEIILGLWINQLGARRAAAYQLLLLAISVFTSYALLAMLRA